MHFSCIVSLCYKKLCTHVRQYIALLFHMILLCEQQYVAGNIIANSTVYCLINVCSCFVMVFKLRCGYGMAGGYLTDVTLHSSRNYHQVRATELRRQSKDVAVAGGAVTLSFHGVSILY